MCIGKQELHKAENRYSFVHALSGLVFTIFCMKKADVVNRQPHAGAHGDFSQPGETQKAPLTEQKPIARHEPAIDLTNRANVTSHVGRTPIVIGDDSEGNVSSDSMSSLIDHPMLSSKAHEPTMPPMQAPMTSFLGERSETRGGERGGGGTGERGRGGGGLG